MPIITILSLSSLGTASLIVALAVPLIFRKVPMNHLYGVRFRVSFRSDEDWYVLNSYGGNTLLAAALPIFLCGVAGLLLPPDDPAAFLWIEPAVTIGSIGIAGLLCLIKARQMQSKKLNYPL